MNDLPVKSEARQEFAQPVRIVDRSSARKYTPYSAGTTNFSLRIHYLPIYYAYIIRPWFIGMKTVNVSGLKNNPSEALRQSHEDMVLVMNRNQPDALMIGLNKTRSLDMPGVRAALATALFKDGELSLARSAHLANMHLADFISHISRLGIPVIKQNADEVTQDMDTLEQWLAS